MNKLLDLVEKAVTVTVPKVQTSGLGWRLFRSLAAGRERLYDQN